MIATPIAVAANQYPAHIHNCQRNAACEPSFSAPVPGIPYLQLYVEFGTLKPFTMEFQLVDHCTGETEQIFPSNYVVGQTPDGIWYGVFKYFNFPVSPVTTFVVWLSVNLLGGETLIEKTFFSEMAVVEPCSPIMKIKACYPEGATLTGFDVNGRYYGLPTNVDYLGIREVRYFHIAWVRSGKVRELSNKGTFKSSLYKTFRSTIERVHQVETELVPKWYKDELLAIYARGAIQVDDGPIYLVSDLNFEAINEDDLTWKPFAQLKETIRQFFGCDDSACYECCSPIVIEATVTSEPGSGSESGSGGGSESGGGEMGLVHFRVGRDNGAVPNNPDEGVTVYYSLNGGLSWTAVGSCLPDITFPYAFAGSVNLPIGPLIKVGILKQLNGQGVSHGLAGSSAFAQCGVTSNPQNITILSSGQVVYVWIHWDGLGVISTC